MLDDNGGRGLHKVFCFEGDLLFSEFGKDFVEIFNRELGDDLRVQGPEKIFEHQSLHQGEDNGLGHILFGEEIVEIEKGSYLESI